jgi:hypothetical protein
MATVLTCQSEWQIQSNGNVRCFDYLTGPSPVEYIPPFDISTLQPEMVVAFVGSGFFILLPLWVAVYGGRVLLTAIKGNY